MRLGFADIPPYTFMGMRYLLAALALWPWVIRARKKRSTAGKIGQMLFLGVLQTGVMNSLVIVGIIYLGGGLTSVLTYTHILITAVLAHFLAMERLNWQKVLAIGMGLAGVVIIFHHQLQLGASRQILLAMLAVLGGAGAWGVASVYVKRYLQEADKFQMNFYQLLAGAGVLLAIAFLTERGQPLIWNAVSTTSFLFCTLIATTFAWTAWFLVLGRMGVIQAVIYLFLVPVFAVVLSILILQESFPVVSVIGMLLIIGGILLVNLPGPRVRLEEDEPGQRVEA